MSERVAEAFEGAEPRCPPRYNACIAKLWGTAGCAIQDMPHLMFITINTHNRIINYIMLVMDVALNGPQTQQVHSLSADEAGAVTLVQA